MAAETASGGALRIGLLTSELAQTHGWARYGHDLALALARAGVRLTVIAPVNSPAVPGLTVHRLLPPVVPAARWLLARQLVALPRVRAALRGCDVVHAAIEPYAPLAALAAGRRPLVITGHGSYVRLPQTRRPPVSWVYRAAFARGALVCVSRCTAQVARAVLPRVPVTVVSNGVDVSRFASLPPRPAPRSGPPTILAVGAVKARKGFMELVRALPAVRQRFPDARCVIVGSLESDPAYVRLLRAAIAELGLEAAVLLPGRVSESELLDWYSRADVFALPAVPDAWKFEGYGLVYLEASAAGLPVIGTAGSGAADAIDDGVTGLLLPPDDLAAALPQALIRLLADPALAARLGAAGRQKAAAQTWDTTAAHMIAVYRQALAGRPAGG